MQDDSDIDVNEDYPEDKTYFSRRGAAASSKSPLLPIVLGILVAGLLGGGVSYLLSGRAVRTETDPLKSKMTAFEQKIIGLERQITDLQGKLASAGQDPLLVQRLDSLAQKVEALENRPAPAVETKAKAAPPKGAAAATEKRYHTVQKGETLTKISKQYGISVTKLRKLNNLPPDYNVQVGQKLVVSN
jgi:LysM repeat protein